MAIRTKQKQSLANRLPDILCEWRAFVTDHGASRRDYVTRLRLCYRH
jgi:hypothetical protein